MKKILFCILLLSSRLAFCDLTGFYLGGGLGYGMQGLSLNGSETTSGTPALRAFLGYQMADWIGVEGGYTYISQASNWNGVGAPSTTIYDIAFTPGFTIPATPVSIYTRFGVDAVSSNLNSAWYNQMFSSMNANFEWGAGVKVNIPATRVFIRAEYTNYSGTTNNNNSNLNVLSSTIMINAAYVF